MPTKDEIRDAVAQFNLISDISEKKRTKDQQERFDAAGTFIQDNYLDCYDLMNETIFERIRNPFEDQSPADRWKNKLDEEAFQIPAKFPETTEQINRTLTKFYELDVNLGGILEKIKPEYASWKGALDRSEKMFNALCNFKERWRSEGIGELMMPDDVEKRVAELGQVVAMYELRRDTAKTAFEKLSRFITIRLGIPNEERSWKENLTDTEGYKERAAAHKGRGGPSRVEDNNKPSMRDRFKKAPEL